MAFVLCKFEGKWWYMNLQRKSAFYPSEELFLGWYLRFLSTNKKRRNEQYGDGFLKENFFMIINYNIVSRTGIIYYLGSFLRQGLIEKIYIHLEDISGETAKLVNVIECDKKAASRKIDTIFDMYHPILLPKDFDDEGIMVTFFIKPNQNKITSLIDRHLKLWEQNTFSYPTKTRMSTTKQKNLIYSEIEEISKKFDTNDILLWMDNYPDIEFWSIILWLENTNSIRVHDLVFDPNQKVGVKLQILNTDDTIPSDKGRQELVYDSHHSKLFSFVKKELSLNIRAGLGKTILDKWFFERNLDGFLKTNDIPSFDSEKYRQLIKNWSKKLDIPQSELRNIIRLSSRAGQQIIVITDKITHK